MNKAFLIAAMATLAVAIPAAAPAQRAGGTVAVVVDMQRVYRDCNACRAANTQLQSQVQALQTRATTLSQPLQTESTAIETAVRALNGRQPDQALQTRIQALQTRQNTANQELGTGEQTIRRNQAFVLQQINQRLNPLLTQVMTSRGANLVIDAGSVLSFAPTLDVTNDVLTQLNQQLPSVSTTAPAAPAQQQPQGR